MEKKKETKKKVSTKAKKVTKKPVQKKKDKKKGFTLIELLAVIIILGILMIIAIPSVTSYISNSRKSAYIDTAKEIVSGTRNVVNQGKLGMYDTNTTYYIPASYIKTEGALKSPYGEFTEAYVGVIYNGSGYSYYWISVDDAGEGIDEIKPYDKLDTDDIKSDLKASDIKDKIESTGIGNRSEIKILNPQNETWKPIHLDDTSGNVPEENGSSLTAASVILATANGSNQLNHIPDTNIYIFKGGTNASPANYVIFNNENWRIIGIYGNKLKIIRVNNYGVPTAPNGFTSVTWHSTTTNPGWANSNLKELLNTRYYNSLSDDAKEMIDENGSWNVGSSGINAIANEAYNGAIITSIVENTEYTTPWIGKIGLMASYEFLYASGGVNCDKLAGVYSSSSGFNLSCGTAANDWMKPGSNSWTLTPDDRHYIGALAVYSGGGVTNHNVGRNYNAAVPAVFLKSSVKIVSGDGTSPENAYILQLN